MRNNVSMRAPQNSYKSRSFRLPALPINAARVCVWSAVALASACSATSPEGRTAQTEVVVVPPKPKAPPDEPLRIERIGKAAPWLTPDSDGVPNWEFVPESPGVHRAVDPILGDPQISSFESDFAVLQTKVGQLVVSAKGVVGLLPKGVRVVGLLASGKVIVENDAGAPLVAVSANAAVKGDFAPWSGVERVFDVAASAAIARVNGEVVRSFDEGKTWKPLGVKEAVDKALIRPDGVTVVSLAGQPPETRWKVVSAKGGVKALAGAPTQLVRWGAWIMSPPIRDAQGSLIKAEVLIRGGTQLELRTLPRQVNTAERLLFRAHFSGPRSPLLWPPWRNVLDAAPVGCREKTGRGERAPNPDCEPHLFQDGMPDPHAIAGLSSSGTLTMSMLSGPVHDVIGFDPSVAKKEPCRLLGCLVEHNAPLTDVVKSTLVARFFDDAFCSEMEGGRCKPGSAFSPPTVGFYDAPNKTLRISKPPEGCVPKRLNAARGLVMIECENGRYAAAQDMVWASETGFLLQPDQGTPWGKSIRWEAADDGTIVGCQGRPGQYVGVHIRPPVGPGATWRSVPAAGLVLCEAVSGGAALLGVTDADGKKLKLWIDAPDGAVPLATSEEVPGEATFLGLENGLIKLVVEREYTREAYTLFKSGRWEFQPKPEK